MKKMRQQFLEPRTISNNFNYIDFEQKAKPPYGSVRSNKFEHSWKWCGA